MPRLRTVYGNQHLKVCRLKQVRRGKPYWSRQWYGRVQYRRQRFNFPLGTDKKKALKQWGKIQKDISNPEISWESILEEHKPGYVGTLEEKRTKRTIPKSGVTLDDHLEFVWSNLSSLDMKHATMQEYEASLLRVVAVGTAQQAGKSNPTALLTKQQKTALRRKPLTVLTRKLVNHYKAAMTEAAEEEGRDILSARRSVNSYLRQARAVFSREIRGRAEDEGIELPDLSKFLEASGFTGSSVRYHLPHDALIKKTFKHLADPNKAPLRDVYIAILLGLFGGLRKGEVAYVGPAQLTAANKKPGINVTNNTKNNKVRFVPLQKPVFNLLKSVAPEESEFFIKGTPTYRTDDLFDETNAWLRSLGWEVNKPFHELRKLFGSMIASTEGLERARQLLDHESIRTTQEHYGDTEMSEEISTLWTEFKPVPRDL